MIHRLASLVPFIKSKYFKFEDEYRLAYHPPCIPNSPDDEGIKTIHYLKDNKIVRGFELKWGNQNPIKSITFGPNFKGDIVELKKHMKLLEFPEIEFYKSNIPVW